MHRRFPRSAKPTANNPRRKPHRSPEPWRNRRPFPAKPSRTRGDMPAGEAAATANADASANRGIERNTPPSPVHPYWERKTGSQRRRPGQRRVTLIQLDTSLNLREKRPGFLLAEAGRPFAQAGLRHLVERVPLFDDHIGGQAAPYAPGPHAHLAASPSTDIANLQGRKRSQLAWAKNGGVSSDALSLTPTIR